MIRRPPRSTRTDTLFPYTTLFRSAAAPDRVSAKRTLNISAPLNRRETGLLRADRYRSLMMWYHSGSRCATWTTVRGTRAAHSWIHERDIARSEERRVGKECGRTGRSRWSQYH